VTGGVPILGGWGSRFFEKYSGDLCGSKCNKKISQSHCQFGGLGMGGVKKDYK